MQTEPTVLEPEGLKFDQKEANQRLIHALLVEDNPGDARLIQIMLEDDGSARFELETTETLRDAFDALSRKSFEIVLLDLSLPDSHGLDTFIQLQGRVPELPIIVLSGLNDTTVAVQAVHEGAQDYMVKGQVEGQLLARAMQYAIERKQLTRQLGEYTKELRAKNAQLEADFKMAREVQEMFLPQQYPTFPRLALPEESVLQFSHRYLPAAAVGGDFFNVFPITNTMAGIFLCDVMGHGMRAALVTAIMRGLVEELMPVAADPGKFLSEINRSLHAILRRTREPFLATALYMVAEAATGELRYSRAGHPSAFRVRRSVRKVESMKQYDPRHGPALGLFDRAQFPTCALEMEPNDLFLLFTDGIYEVDNAQQEEYGIERLQAAIQRRSGAPTSRMLDEVLGEVRRFAAVPEFEDDVCLLAMEVRESGFKEKGKS